MVRARRTRSRFAGGCLLVLLDLSACDGNARERPATTPGAASGAPTPAGPSVPLSQETRAAKGFPVQRPRSGDERVSAAIAALERGDLSGAGRILLALPSDDLDAQLLRARLSALEGDSVGAVRIVEQARRAWPDQGRVYAAAGEIHASAGRLASAEGEVREGLARCGPTPELSLARGVLALSREGGASIGLNHLLEARAADPDLPFLAAPLLAAHLLLSRQALAQGDVLDALGHARAALAVDPHDVEARTLQADALAASGDLTAALDTYEGLLADGEGVEDTLALLSQRAATAALIQGRRELAVERHLRARELGLPESELGFGATLLAEESASALEQGVALYQEGRTAAAAERFERALRLDPGSLSARNHLGVVRFKLGEYEPAAAHWRRVLDTARLEGIELPEPVHLNLARALFLLERTDEARSLLESELERDPEGPYAEATRELLGRL